MKDIGNELSCRSYWMENYYEPMSFIALGAISDRIGTFVDIGSNVGIFTLFVSASPTPPKIFAFEPNPSVCNLLETNCKINKQLKNDQFHNIAPQIFVNVCGDWFHCVALCELV